MATKTQTAIEYLMAVPGTLFPLEEVPEYKALAQKWRERVTRIDLFDDDNVPGNWYVTPTYWILTPVGVRRGGKKACWCTYDTMKTLCGDTYELYRGEPTDGSNTATKGTVQKMGKLSDQDLIDETVTRANAVGKQYGLLFREEEQRRGFDTQVWTESVTTLSLVTVDAGGVIKTERSWTFGDDSPSVILETIAKMFS